MSNETIVVRICDGATPLVGGRVTIKEAPQASATTDVFGYAELDLGGVDAKLAEVHLILNGIDAALVDKTFPVSLIEPRGRENPVIWDLKLGFRLAISYFDEHWQPINRPPRVGDLLVGEAVYSAGADGEIYAKDAKIFLDGELKPVHGPHGAQSYKASGAIAGTVGSVIGCWVFETPKPTPRARGEAAASATVATHEDPPRLEVRQAVIAQPVAAQPISGTIALVRSATPGTADLPLYQNILDATEKLSYSRYADFMDSLFNADAPGADPVYKQKFQQLLSQRFVPFTNAEAYRQIKAATEAFVMVNCAVLSGPSSASAANRAALREVSNGMQISDYLEDYDGDPDGRKTLPYLAVIRRKLADNGIAGGGTGGAELDDLYGLIQDKLVNPCMMELIWSYWHEEGMLVQTLNAITRRFQNVRSSARDPLANLEIDPLRPLSNLLWGYTQDEQHRLSVVRRNYEYDHHYGLRLEGRAVQNLRPADSRSRFIEAFHNLLRLCLSFYRQDDDTTVKADAFPVLNALKEVHLILSQGAHNQFGDLPSTARIEMLMQQWLLARPEFREFLPTRIMVAYPEPWMDRVDAMKKLQGWTDTSVLHFRDLATFGEKLLLTIRWGHWNDVYEPQQAFNWARLLRPQVQGYVHAYRAATGVDMTADKVNERDEAMLPAILLQRRLTDQTRVAQRA